MLIPPRYELTPELVSLLNSIEASRQVIDSIEIPLEIEQNIRRVENLKSSLFSARIEGNNLNLEDLQNPSKTQKKAEVLNILKAMNFLKEKQKKDITTAEMLALHKITMNGLIDGQNLGVFRKNMEAIFNSAGIAIFMPPSPKQVPSLIEKLIKFINSDKERFAPIKASLTHYTFEKIHPFLDGSGRVGRLLIQKILYKEGFGMKGLLSLEEYLDNHRSTYYRMLEEPEKELTDYLIFMLTAISETALKAKELVQQKQKVEVEDYLLPRRAEILRIIKDQKIVNFDQIRRRFMAVNPRTLRYDLKKLQDANLIRKLGTTNGVYYEEQK
ncbi:MAG: Fic family protein [Candidatus Woesebacteria bacterium]|nr:MAG: Fic family protein [Candidatus Woesebacteria bacterium]